MQYTVTADHAPATVPTPYRVRYQDGSTVAHCQQPQEAQRIADCLNACAGMDDPAAEIARMRDVLESVAAGNTEIAALEEAARAALRESSTEPASTEYRIIGYYEDNGQRYDHTQAGENWQDALQILAEGDIDADALWIVSILHAGTGDAVDIGIGEATIADLLGEV